MKHSKIKQHKLNLIEHILDESNVVDRFRPTMRKTLLKLNHKDLSNLALGFIVY